MKRIPRPAAPILLCAFSALAVFGCSSPSYLLTTRSETETIRVSRAEEESRSEPLGEDYGVLRPSRKQTIIHRTITEYDSVCKRYYPRFARYGAFEVAGLVTGMDSKDNMKIGNGLFGVYNTFAPPESRRDAIQNGYQFRIGMWEGRLPFIGKDWIAGTTLFEGIFGDAEGGHELLGFLPIYLKKRFYLREETPLIFIEPFIGASLLTPYRYAHIGASLNLGSYGGANVFARLGIATGSPVSDSDVKNASGRTVPYAGLGVSFFDFYNTEREMDTPWKEHEVRARRTGFLHLTMLQSSTGASQGIVFDEGDRTDLIEISDFDGFILQFATVAFPFEIIHERVTIGTSLINLMYLGDADIGIGILPLRMTYAWWIWRKVLLEPFVEINYYPSSVGHAGVRFMLGDIGGISLGLQAGGMYGNSGDLTRNLFKEFTTDVKGVYAGISVGLGDFYSSPIVDYFKTIKDCRTPYGEY